MSQPQRRWRTATRCSTNTCVATAFTADTVYVRDSKQPDGPTIAHSPAQWRWLCDTLKAGGVPGRIDATGTGDVRWYGDHGVVLTFTRQEWDVFVGDDTSGVKGGEFDIEHTAA